MRNHPQRRSSAESEIVPAGMLELRQGPHRVHRPAVAQAGRGQGEHGALDVDHVVIAHAHPDAAPAALPELGHPGIVQQRAELDHHVQALHGLGKGHELQLGLLQHQPWRKAVPVIAVDHHGGPRHQGRSLQQLHQEHHVLQCAVLPDRLGVVAHEQGHPHAQPSRRGRGMRESRVHAALREAMSNSGRDGRRCRKARTLDSCSGCRVRRKDWASRR